MIFACLPLLCACQKVVTGANTTIPLKLRWRRCNHRLDQSPLLLS